MGIRFTQGPGHAVERVGWGPTEALSLPREVYLTHFEDSVQGITGTNDLNGTLRMVRTGAILTGYYRSSTSWIMIHTGPTQDNAGDVHFGFSAWSGNPVFAGQTTKVGFSNFTVSSGQLLCPAFKLSPTEGPIGTRVQIQASGFPTSNYSPDQVIVSFDDNFLGIVTSTNGNFNFTFNVPDAQPGFHLVKAVDELSGGSATANFIVTSLDSLVINLDVGTLYFPGDTASIFTLATLSGTPLNSTILQLQLTLTKPDGTNSTLSNTFIGGGLFQATYAIPRSGPTGTFAIVAKAHVANSEDVSALATFEVKQTWLSAQGPALAATGVAITGAVAVAGVLCRKGVLRSKID